MSNNNFNDILNEINNTKAPISCYAVSTKENVSILPLTLAQQKSIIETSMDSTLAALFFNSTFYKILKQNFKGDISKYNTIDRVNFAIALRSQLSDSYSSNDIKYSLSEILKRNTSLPCVTPDIVVSSENYSFNVKVPNLLLDDRVNSLLLSKYKNENLNGVKLKTLISDLFVHEILKFITKLKVNDKEIDLHIDLQSSVSLIEKIDSSKFTEVTKYINNVREVERSFAILIGANNSIDIIPEFFIV
jgi:hypothetical protein